MHGLPLLDAGHEDHVVLGSGLRTIVSEVTPCGSYSSNGLEGFMDCGGSLSKNPVNSLALAGIEGDVRVRNLEVDDLCNPALKGNLGSNLASVLMNCIGNEETAISGCIAPKALGELSEVVIYPRALGTDSLLAGDNQEVMESVKKRSHKPI